MDDVIPVAVGGTFLIAATAFLVFIFVRAFSRQRRAYAQIDESLDLSRRSVELAERQLYLTEHFVRNQEEIIRLLREAMGRGAAPAEAPFAGVRLPLKEPPASRA